MLLGMVRLVDTDPDSYHLLLFSLPTPPPPFFFSPKAFSVMAVKTLYSDD